MCVRTQNDDFFKNTSNKTSIKIGSYEKIVGPETSNDSADKAESDDVSSLFRKLRKQSKKAS